MDTNGDGIPELIGNLHSNNRGKSVDLSTHIFKNINYPPAAVGVMKGEYSYGDIDGDGLPDVVVRRRDLQGHLHHGVMFSTGLNYTSQGAEGYVAALDAFVPPPEDPAHYDPNNIPSPHFELADLNGDGLVDLVLDHAPMGNLHLNDHGGQVLVNTGTGWTNYSGPANSANGANWAAVLAAQPASARVPIVPTHDPNDVSRGASWVDLDGDGVTDLVWSVGNQRQAWLNKFRPPIIAGFPSGLAAPSQVSYVTITAKDGEGVYLAQGDRAPGTRFLMVPLRVVSSVSEEDGAGIGTMKTRTFQYESLRGSDIGRGPLGFAKMRVIETIHDPDAQRDLVTTTVTSFLQAYPYTGATRSVVKYLGLESGGIKLTETNTDYCDVTVDVDDEPNCTPMSGGDLPPKTSIFIHPLTVTDTAYLLGDDGQTTVATQTTTTEFWHDTHGNPTLTKVTTSSPTGGTFVKSTRKWFGEPNSDTEALGKEVWTVATASQVGVPTATVTHTTGFEYEHRDSWIDSSVNDGTHQALALTRVKVEPQSTEPGARVDTVYEHDTFGNVITTVNCAADFDDCIVGAQGPGNLPFRTNRVSFDPQDYAPGAAGPGLSATYRRGRFPVRMTNAADHVEYTLYDETSGQKTVEIDANGIATCHKFDAFGRPSEEIARCTSGYVGLKTTIERYKARSDDPSPARYVTITTPAAGSPVWVYSDVFGRTINTRTRSYDGGFIESSTQYDPRGQVVTQSRPHILGVESAHMARTFYDQLGRATNLLQDLDVIDGTGTPKISTTSVSFQGLTTVTKKAEVAGIANANKRTEVKNAMGKITQVIDVQGASLYFTYDADGNAKDVYSASSHTVTVFDVRGRKKSTDDPDAGHTEYEYNGFGDLIRQVDANGETEMVYDQLGRLVRRSDPMGASEWIYDRRDQGGAGIGKLSATMGPVDPRLTRSCELLWAPSTAANRPMRMFAYSSAGDLVQTTECVDGDYFVTDSEYDEVGRPNVVRYPAIGTDRLSVRYHYTDLGFVQYIQDETDGGTYWVATEMNGAGQVTKEYTRNGVETVSTRNPATGWLMASRSTSLANEEQVIQGWAYQYDELGNLRQRDRSDDLNPHDSVEVFGYDHRYRLINAHTMVMGMSYDHTETYDYTDAGTLFTKNGHTYSVGCGGRTHAVCSIDGGPSFVYDGHGNLTEGAGRTIVYNASNKAILIDSHPSPSQGNDQGVVEYVYGADGNRVVQDVQTRERVSLAKTVYLNLGITGKSLYERTVRGEAVDHVQFLYAGSGESALAVRTTTVQGATSQTRLGYYHRDHLGSITAVSDEQGRVSELSNVLGYDAWGARRNPVGTEANAATFNPAPGHRGFTGHETIPNVGLVNMNGRLYDPILGFFLSPDPSVQFISDLQSHNRYSYARNNPLGYTDPTGYWIHPLFDLSVTVSLAITAAYVCTGPQAGLCAVAFLVGIAVYNASSQIHDGTPWDIAVLNGVFTVAIGGLGGAISSGLGGGIIGGAASGAFQAYMMTPMTGGSTGENVLRGALKGAVTGAAEMAAKDMVSVHRGNQSGTGDWKAYRVASAQAADGGGEVADESEWILARSGGTTRKGETVVLWGDVDMLEANAAGQPIPGSEVLWSPNAENEASFVKSVKPVASAATGMNLSKARWVHITDEAQIAPALAGGNVRRVVWVGHVITYGSTEGALMLGNGAEIDGDAFAKMIPQHASVRFVGCDSRGISIQMSHANQSIQVAPASGDLVLNLKWSNDAAQTVREAFLVPWIHTTGS